MTHSHVSLASLTTMGVGGAAGTYVEADCEEALIQALREADGQGVVDDASADGAEVGDDGSGDGGGASDDLGQGDVEGDDGEGS